MTEIKPNIKFGFLYQVDLDFLLITDDHTVRQIFIPEIGFELYARSCFNLVSRFGLGIEYWKTTYTTDALAPEFYSPPYSVTAFEPVASIDLCEQIFYKWIGISFVEGVKINQNGYEISFSLGLMLKNYSRSKEDNRHIISTTSHNMHQ